MDADQDRGSIAIEAAILVPAILLFLLLVIAAGRAQTAQGAVDAAVRDAARSASLMRTEAGAEQAAGDTVAATLDQEGVNCQDENLDVRYAAGTQGQAGSVQVTLLCHIPVGDLAVPGLPGTVSRHSSFTSVLDLYRASS